MEFLTLRAIVRNRMCNMTVKSMSLIFFRSHSGQFCIRLPCVSQWRVVYISSKIGRFRDRNIIAWSSGKSETLPIFRMNGGVLANRGFISILRPTVDCERCYSVQRLKDNVGKEQKQSVDSSSTDNSKDVSHINDKLHTVNSTNESKEDVVASETDITESGAQEKVGLMKRFKMMYKQYGVVLVCVHAFTASIWVSMFYCATASGVDVVPLLRWLGASDTVISPFLVPGVGKAAVIYLMYKLATPARYTVTIAGTQLAVKLLRRRGYLKVPETATGKPDSLRSIVKDGRAKVKDRMDDIRDDVHELRSKFRTQMNNQNSSTKAGK